MPAASNRSWPWSPARATQTAGSSRRGPNRGRLAAAEALIRVERGAHAEDALAELLPAEPRDRRLGWFLAMGVLRRRPHVDAALRPHLRTPLASLDPEVRAALRLGAFEKLYGRAEARAVVHEAVEVARRLKAHRATGLVNAILRRVQPPTDLGRADSLDHPPWLVARWDARYGTETTASWCRSHAEPPPLTVALRGDGPPGVVLHPVRIRGEVLEGVGRIDDHVGPITDLPGFAEGAFWVQDAASVAAADEVGAGQGTRVLDACAAPGGKAFRMASAGARITAVDRSADRLELVAEGARRLGLSIEMQVHDWATGPLPGRPSFDAVLVDAPCTGLGTVRRHPEIRWRRHEPDLEVAAARQRSILAAASQHVAPGGTLVYAVCSVEPEEGTEVVEAFLAQHPAFKLERAWQTVPPEEGEDAHYAARLGKGHG